MSVVLTIIGLLPGIVSVDNFRYAKQARWQAATVQVQAFAGAIASFYAESARYPTAEEGLPALRKYLTNDVPLDPWGRPYLYEITASGEPRVKSLGADGQPGGDGVNADVFSWK